MLPAKQHALQNQPSIHFDCNANGSPKPHVAWLLNGQRILRTERVSIYQNGSLFIANVEESDAGEYTCQAENLHGKTAATAALEVYGNVK